MNKAIKYRIYPTTEQREFFAKTFGCCRKVYNLMLADKIAHYEETGKNLMTTPAKYKKEHPYLREVDSLALANEQLHLQTAYKNFFRDVKIGFPKFKSAKCSRKSYTTNNQNGTVAIKGKHIRLPKVGLVKAKLHRLPKEDWKLKSATISQTSDGKYYISVLFEYEEAIVTVYTNKVIGLDYKSDGLYMDSNGSVGSNHKYYKESHRKLARLQRRLSRKAKGSSNRNKQRIRVAKVHEKITSQRKDFLHKLSTMLVRENQTICIEELAVKNMVKNHKLARSINSVSWSKFFEMLEYKSEWYGSAVVRIPTNYPSSQTCGCCGYKNTLVKNLSVRKWECPNCGEYHDRDVNAARNILNKGLQLVA